MSTESMLGTTRGSVTAADKRRFVATVDNVEEAGLPPTLQSSKASAQESGQQKSKTWMLIVRNARARSRTGTPLGTGT